MPAGGLRSHPGGEGDESSIHAQFHEVISGQLRFLGLILTAIAIEFIASDIKGLFPVLAGAPAPL